MTGKLETFFWVEYRRKWILTCSYLLTIFTIYLQDWCSFSYVSGTVVRTWQRLIHFTLITILISRYYNHPHFTDERPKTLASEVVLVVKNPPANAEDLRDAVWSLSQEDALEKGIATHSRILAQRIPGTEEPGRLQSIGSHRVGHDWRNLA